MAVSYGFKTGFYGLTKMSEIQKAIDTILIGLTNTYCFFDGTPNFTGGTLDKRLCLVKKSLRKLDDINLRLKLSNSYFAKNEIEWLGYIFSTRGIGPLESKTSVIFILNPPNLFKIIGSFLGSVHHISKFEPNLATKANPSDRYRKMKQKKTYGRKP